MAKDYKNVSSARAPARKSAPGWVWLLVGLMVGLFVAFLVYLRDRAPDKDIAAINAELHKRVEQTVDKASAKKGDGTDNKAADKASDEPGKPRFDFYSILPELEVVIPDLDILDKSGKKSSSTSTPVPVQQAGTYVLQVGSFRQFEEADRLNASLALLGIKADIQKVKINDKDTWHRVRVGPYQDLAELNKMRQRLQEHRIESMLLRINT